MSHGWSRVRVRQAVRGCVLEGYADAAARGVVDGLFGLVVQAVVLQAATGRSHGGEVGIREHAWSARPAGGRGTQSRAASRGCECGRRAGCREEGKGTKARDVLAIDASRNVQGRERKCSQMCQRAFTERQTLGGGALEVGDVCLFKDGSERNCALVSDVVVPETARGGGNV